MQAGIGCDIREWEASDLSGLELLGFQNEIHEIRVVNWLGGAECLDHPPV